MGSIPAASSMRPDVTIANKYGYPEEDVYADMPFEMRSRFRTIPTESEEALIEDWVIANTDKPVYFTKKRRITGAPGVTMANTGLLYRAVRPGETPPGRDFWAEYTWRSLEPADTRGEYSAELVVSDYHFFRGRDWLEKGDTEQGLAALEQALSIAGGSKEAYNNIGSVCAEYGEYPASIAYYEKAIALDPDYEMVLRNLGKVYIQTGQHVAAIAPLERLAALEPEDPEANWLLVDCLKNAGRPDAAIAQLEKMAETMGGDARIFRELGMLYLNHKRDSHRAHTMFAESLKLNPNQPDLATMMARPQTPPDMPSLPNMPGGLPSVPGFTPPGPQLPQLPQMPTLPQTRERRWVKRDSEQTPTGSGARNGVPLTGLMPPGLWREIFALAPTRKESCGIAYIDSHITAIQYAEVCGLVHLGCHIPPIYVLDSVSPDKSHLDICAESAAKPEPDPCVWRQSGHLARDSRVTHHHIANLSATRVMDSNSKAISPQPPYPSSHKEEQAENCGECHTAAEQHSALVWQKPGRPHSRLHHPLPFVGPYAHAQRPIIGEGLIFT